MKHPLREIKRVISQWIERRYWYDFRAYKTFWFNDETNKYEERKDRGFSKLNITWDGENDILGMMLMKIEHMYHNLKHYGVQCDFYLDAHNVIKYGNEKDINWAFHTIMSDNDPFKEENKKDWLLGQFNYLNEDGSKESRFIYGWDNNEHSLKVVMKWIAKDCFKCCTYDADGNEVEFHGDVVSTFGKGIVENVYTIIVPVTEYKELSDALKPHVRGNRRTLTQLLHLRHLVKRLYCLSDTDDKYFNMWKDIQDEDLQREKMIEAEKLYESDRRKLYLDIAEFMAEYGRGWWD